MRARGSMWTLQRFKCIWLNVVLISVILLACLPSAVQSDPRLHKPCKKKGYFGDDCKFKCRCKDDTTCSPENGTCKHNRCAGGWFGTACQYRTADLKSVPEYLTDGDNKTCNTEHDQKELFVSLEGNSRLTWIMITISSGDFTDIVVSHTFQLFAIRFEECPKRGVLLDDGLTWIAICPTLEAVRIVKISGKFVPHICSLYINRGRNVAIRQKVTMTDLDPKYTPEASVDGFASVKHKEKEAKKHCASSLSTATEAHLTLTFDLPVSINSIVVYSGDDTKLKGFTLTVFNGKKPIFNWTDVFEDASEMAAIFPGPKMKGLATSLSIYKKPGAKQLTICELEVYGEVVCHGSKHGFSCEHEDDCHCANEEQCLPYGGCLNGCSAGFLGQNCDTRCPRGFYGDKCSRNCGLKCEEKKCRPENGSCTLGCVNIAYNMPDCVRTVEDVSEEGGYNLFGIALFLLVGIIFGAAFVLGQRMTVDETGYGEEQKRVREEQMITEVKIENKEKKKRRKSSKKNKEKDEENIEKEDEEKKGKEGEGKEKKSGKKEKKEEERRKSTSSTKLKTEDENDDEADENDSDEDDDESDDDDDDDDSFGSAGSGT